MTLSSSSDAFGRGRRIGRAAHGRHRPDAQPPAVGSLFRTLADLRLAFVLRHADRLGRRERCLGGSLLSERSDGAVPFGYVYDRLRAGQPASSRFTGSGV